MHLLPHGRSVFIDPAPRYSGRQSLRHVAVLSVAQLSNGSFLKPTLSLLLSAPVRTVVFFATTSVLSSQPGFCSVVVVFTHRNIHLLTDYSPTQFQVVFSPAVSWRIPRPRILSLWLTSTSAVLGTQVTGPKLLSGTHAPQILCLVHYFYQFTPSTICPKRSSSPTALPTDIIRPLGLT